MFHIVISTQCDCYVSHSLGHIRAGHVEAGRQTGRPCKKITAVTFSKQPRSSRFLQGTPAAPSATLVTYTWPHSYIRIQTSTNTQNGYTRASCWLNEEGTTVSRKLGFSWCEQFRRRRQFCMIFGFVCMRTHFLLLFLFFFFFFRPLHIVLAYDRNTLWKTGVR